MEIKVKLPVYISTEAYIEQEPDAVYVTLTPNLLERIFELQKYVEDKDIFLIKDSVDKSTFDFIRKEENDDLIISEQKCPLFRYELLYLCINKYSIYYTFYIENTEDRGSSEAIYKEDLQAMYQAMTMPREELPLLINSSSEYIQAIVKQRLKDS